jgi:hypothetical protein
MKTVHTSKVIRLNGQPMMNVQPVSNVLLKVSDNFHDYSLPVIRIDYKGRILYSNKASFPLLKEWNCLANDYLPEALVRNHPDVLRLDADFDLAIETKSFRFHLDVIGFRECGYIGLYGFQIKSKEASANGNILKARAV